MGNRSFQRLGPATQHVLMLAQDEARALEHSLLGPQHILLGMARPEVGPPAATLRELGATYDAIREVVRGMLTPHLRDKSVPAPPHIPLAPHTKALIEAAAEEADRSGSQQVAPEHLLLALVRDEKGFVAYLLSRTGTTQDAYQQLRTRLRERTGKPDGAATPRPEPAPPAPALLAKLGTDLTAQARESLLDPVIGRDAEIERTVQVLRRRSKNNVVLLGEPGVGKTAIVEGLAQLIADGDLPFMSDTTIWSLDVGSLLAGAVYRGQFEERLGAVVDEVVRSKSILFIDEFHMVIGAGSTDNSVDAANILKPALARGKLRVIGATTFDEYQRHVEKDPALKRRLQPVVVEEPHVDHTVGILRGLRPAYEAHHELSLTDESLHTAAHLSARYLPDLYLPGKAIDLLDEAASRVWCRRQKQDPDPPAAVTGEDVAGVLSAQTGIPVSNLLAVNTHRSGEVAAALASRIVGQEDAVEAAASAIQRAYGGARATDRPTASLLLVGPPGVGKTELAKALAEHLLGSSKALVRLDLAEYLEAHSISRLIGAPPGYVGYEQGGQLTEAVRRRPYCVILLEDIDRAHADVLNVFLQVLSEGFVLDGKGRRVDFRNTVVLATAAVDMDLLKSRSGLGFRVHVGTPARAARYAERKESYLAELGERVRGDLVPHVDEVIAFGPLEQDGAERLVDVFLRETRELLTARGIELELTPEARGVLASGYDREQGARSMRQLIQSQVLGPVVDALVNGRYTAGDVVQVVDNGEGGVTVR